MVERGIRSAGLEGYLDPASLMEEITIRPRSDASLITTQFVISYEVGEEDELGAVSADGLLSAILYSYVDHFHEIYTNDQIALNMDVINAEMLEYIDFVDYYEEMLVRLKKYISTQQESNKDFISSDGTSFQDLVNVIDQYRLTSLKEIRSVITERGVTQERGTYIERLNYRIWNLTNSYDYNRKLQQLYKRILQDYEARLTSVVFIPSLDSGRKFYMSKTKVGIDIYALNATNYEEKAEELMRQTKQTEQYISKIVDRVNSSREASNTERVDTMINKLKSQIDATMSQILAVEKEYSQYKNHNYVTINPVYPGFIDRTNAKEAIVITTVLDLAILAVLMLRKQKRKGGGMS
ncbi:MAG: hypothetical protein ACSW8F_01165 [bacterium]